MNVPYGLCQCGCGEKTKVHPKSWARMGWVRGEPRLYKKGHASRRQKMREMFKKMIPVAQDIRHRQMEASRKKRHVKAGTAMKAKSFADQAFSKSHMLDTPPTEGVE